MTIQEIGTEILGGNPKKFYVFGGSEYGIKETYIQVLKNHYGAQKEAYSVEDVLAIMSTKHFIPLRPMVYVIRYDADFIKALSEAYKSKIISSNIVGTIVCIYEADKDVAKCEKYLPDNTVRIDKVSRNFMIKYLHSDFNRLPDKLIDLAADISTDYSQAKNLCRCMSSVPVEELYHMTDSELSKLFGKASEYGDQEIRNGVASRNYSYMVKAVEGYPGSLDSVFYSILSTMIELEKVKCSKYASSDIREYSNRWTLADIYNMFMNTYNEIQKLRSYAADSYSSLMYLLGLMQFSAIPSVEEMS